jgi:hypothetical protein
MPVSRQMLGIPGDECICGRRATIRHCPECGSSRIYGRSGRVHKYSDGTEKLVQTEFRCQACTHLFVDEEREFCQAPAVGRNLAMQKVSSLAEAARMGDTLTPTERIIAKNLLKVDEAQTPSTIMTEEERNKLVTELRKGYRYHLLAFNAGQRPDHPGPIDEFVEKGLKQFEQDWIKASRS